MQHKEVHMQAAITYAYNEPLPYKSSLTVRTTGLPDFFQARKMSKC